MNEYDKILNIIFSLQFKLSNDSYILDFGCGDGCGVRYLSEKGFTNVYGCDLELLNTEEQNIFLIEQPYKLPFEDNYFDFIYSSQVFEHIKDYSLSLSEIRRVLKPNGFSLHIFPPKWRLVEAHTFVPLAGVLHNYYWLYFWAHLGIKNQFQVNNNPSEIAKLNHNYLLEYTNYLSRKEILEITSKFFDDIRFCELARLKYSKMSKSFAIIKLIPYIQWILGTFNMRIMIIK